MIFSYCVTIEERQDCVYVIKYSNPLAFISVSPMEKILGNENHLLTSNCDDETAEFNAATHLQFFEKTCILVKLLIIGVFV